MKNAVCAVMSLVSLVCAAAAASLERGPYLQMVAPTELTIRWRTDVAQVGRVWFGASGAALHQEQAEGASRAEHEVRLTGLTPDTRYYYAVGSAGEVLAGGDAATFFCTAPVTGRARSLRVWVVGDAGRANSAQRATRDAYYDFTGSRPAKALVMLGDNVYDTGTDEEFQTKFFEIYAPLLRCMPTWPTLGNHDTGGSSTPNPNYPYHLIFTLPTTAESGGVASGTERYYSFDIGDAHFVCLDSMTSDRSPTGPMAEWLRADLAASSARWRIAFFHHPAYSHGGNNSDTVPEQIEMRTTFVPIFDTFGMDLVFAGHSHNYERSWPVAGHTGPANTFAAAMRTQAGFGRPAEDGAYVKSASLNPPAPGTIYVVAGSASSVGGGALNHPAMAVSLNELGTVVIDIRGAHLEVKFLRETGAVRDSFTLIKPWNAADADGDAMPDDFERAYNFNPASAADAFEDADGDLVANRDELLAATDPRDPAHAPQLAIERQSGILHLRFPSVANVRYDIEWRDSPMPGPWSMLSSGIPGTGEELVVADPLANGAPRRFYRLRAGP